MPGRPPNPVLRLPRQWNTRGRSAVLHAISLAQLALTAARAQAIERHRARTHRYCGRDRLRQELNLLREEMRLKDVRMARIPRHRRPYYQSTERLSILELRAARGWSLEQTAERMLVTPATVASWMGRLDEGGVPMPSCKHPSQSTSTRPSSPTTCGDSRFSVPSWARLVSPTCRVALGCTSAPPPSDAC